MEQSGLEAELSHFQSGRVLGILILYMIYADFDFTQLWGAISEMDMTWFVVSTFFGIMSHVIRGWRWKLTLAERSCMFP